MNGETLKGMRQSKVATQQEVALAVGMTVANYNRIETGKQMPREGAIRKLAEYFGVDPAELRDKLASQVA